jgi:nitrogen regulatory protein PII
VCDVPFHNSPTSVWHPKQVPGSTAPAVWPPERTGKIGDGKIFVLELRETVRIRTGETGVEAV